MDIFPGELQQRTYRLKMRYISKVGDHVRNLLSICVNHVNGCHRNQFFFKLEKRLSLRTNILCTSGVPLNDLARMNNCPGVQGRSN